MTFLSAWSKAWEKSKGADNNLSSMFSNYIPRGCLTVSPICELSIVCSDFVEANLVSG